ncbi:hypothetical protein [Sinorhizobium meliloti]|uniref:hypothetical protein n=1 Tax=Rhizobium meliloti TaxID=382 RepID=UPI0013E3FDA4|nr:hypothetical protein [Sinorhizobium meliloti]
MLGLLDWAKIGSGLALGAFIASGPVYLYGKATGRQQAAVAALESSVKILRKKGEIDAQVSSSDAASLCAYYGLPDDEQAECMRRVRSASAEVGDNRLHPPERPAVRERRGGP